MGMQAVLALLKKIDKAVGGDDPRLCGGRRACPLALACDLRFAGTRRTARR